MGDVLEAAISLPTVIFTALLVIALVLWVLSIVGGTDLDVTDALDGDGGLEGIFGALGLAGVPPLIVFTVLSVSAWSVSMVAELLLGDQWDGAGAAIASLVIGLGALAVALVISSAAARPLARAFVGATTPSRGVLLGLTAVVRTRRADGTGQAAVRRPDGAELVVDVRAVDARPLAAGTTGHIVGYDDASDIFLLAFDQEQAP